MIVVTDIKTLDINENSTTITRAYITDFNHVYAETNDSAPQQVKLHRETIYGLNFQNIRNQRVCIGMAEQVQEALGLPFSVFAQMSHQLEQLRRENAYLRLIVEGKLEKRIVPNSQKSYIDKPLRCIIEI